ncbi:hypothetical protein RF11_07871 [Thelohanellus kitauei]|uniref:Uncharacterized protein n=1 Tax=Thelohanellus kitauei TaxID=669202 RepID=A0A0C2M869_THEKT|nr:hypothetical protein RF11_07871 [Thelohanellus kitauei]
MTIPVKQSEIVEALWNHSFSMVEMHKPSQSEGVISLEPSKITLNRSVSDLGDAVFTTFFHFENNLFNQHGLDPIGFVEPHVVHHENTFVYSIGQQLFKNLLEVSTKLYYIELMILWLEECQVSSVPEIRNRPV